MVAAHGLGGCLSGRDTSGTAAEDPPALVLAHRLRCTVGLGLADHDRLVLALEPLPGPVSGVSGGTMLEMARRATSMCTSSAISTTTLSSCTSTTSP